MRILVVEDNTDIAESVATALRQMDHAVDVADDGIVAEQLLSAEPYDLAVLDLNLPRKNGLEILKDIRGKGKDIPVLILTARADMPSRVEGLDLGADDYLTKPFHLEELEARVRALLRRRHQAGSTVVELGPLSFDTVSREFELDGQTLELTRRERGVLEVLVNASGRVVGKAQIAEHLFSFDDEVSPSAIEIYVHRLRKKLDTADLQIKTVRGLGYTLQKND
jgi:DNA-binding response OmpR family regulator